MQRKFPEPQRDTNTSLKLPRELFFHSTNLPSSVQSIFIEALCPVLAIQQADETYSLSLENPLA